MSALEESNRIPLNAEDLLIQENKLMNDYSTLDSLLPDNKKYKEIIKQKQLITNGIK